MSNRKSEFLPGFIETVTMAIKILGVNEVAETLRISPEIVRKYAAGTAQPVEYRQRDIIDTLSQFI